jgi:hypothetical protein
VQEKLKDLKQKLRQRMNEPLPVIGKWLGQVLRGHYQYYGVPRNISALKSFRHRVTNLWIQSSHTR